MKINRKLNLKKKNKQIGRFLYTFSNTLYEIEIVFIIFRAFGISTNLKESLIYCQRKP